MSAEPTIADVMTELRELRAAGPLRCIGCNRRINDNRRRIVAAGWCSVECKRRHEPDAADISRRSADHLARAYKLTPERHAEMLAEQGGCCFICKKPGYLVVDHDHDTNQVRALICVSCNLLVGWVDRLRKRPESLAPHLAYVDHFAGKAG